MLVALAIILWLLWHVLRLEALKAHSSEAGATPSPAIVEAAGLAVGTSAPSFTLPTVAGELTSLGAMATSARPRKAKVFGIGLSRSGTTSLTNALQLLGYETVHFPQDPVTRAEVYRFLACRPTSISLALLQDTDALTDIPVCCLYQALDRAYPGSEMSSPLRMWRLMVRLSNICV